MVIIHFFSGMGPKLLDATGQGVLWGLMVLGVYITYKLLDIADLTVDGSFALGGCVCAMLIVQKGVNPFLALFLATLAGMAAGLVTGALHTAFDIPAILAGILTQLALWSVNLWVMGKSNTPLAKVDNMVSLLAESTGFSQAKASQLIGIGAAIAVVALLYWFFGTEIGSAIRATGNNEDMIRALGVNTKWTKLLGLMISNGLVGLSGALVCQSQKYADVMMGQGAIVIGLAAIVIGEVLFGRGGPHALAKGVLAATVGAVVYRIIVAAAIAVNIDAKNMKLVSALIVAAAISYPAIRDKVLFYRKRREANRNV